MEEIGARRLNISQISCKFLIEHSRSIINSGVFFVG